MEIDFGISLYNRDLTPQYNEDDNGEEDRNLEASQRTEDNLSFLGSEHDFFTDTYTPVLGDEKGKRLMSPLCLDEHSNRSDENTVTCSSKTSIESPIAPLLDEYDDMNMEDEEEDQYDGGKRASYIPTQTHVTMPTALRPSIIPIHSSCSPTSPSLTNEERDTSVSIRTSGRESSKQTKFSPLLVQGGKTVLAYGALKKGGTPKETETTEQNETSTDSPSENSRSPVCFSITTAKSPSCPVDSSPQFDGISSFLSNENDSILSSNPPPPLIRSGLENCFSMTEFMGSSLTSSKTSQVMDSTVLHSGLLYNYVGPDKVGYGWWRLRHFVLTINALKYYKKENGKCGGTIDLTSCTKQSIQILDTNVRLRSIPVPFIRNQKTLWKFTIQTKKKKRYYLAAYSEEDLNVWMKKLTLAFSISRNNNHLRFTEPAQEH